MKKILFLFTLLISLSVFSQTIYKSQVFNPQIKTLQIGVMGEKMGLPIIELNGSNTLQIKFDEMSHEAHAYSFKVLHCNADWTLSNLNSNEYLNGFITGNITDFTLSLNTTFL
ncbi:MAG: type IX secretion system plug protein domain-containing protein, partial [Paludibacter sp.]